MVINITIVIINATADNVLRAALCPLPFQCGAVAHQPPRTSQTASIDVTSAGTITVIAGVITFIYIYVYHFLSMYLYMYLFADVSVHLYVYLFIHQVVHLTD